MKFQRHNTNPIRVSMFVITFTFISSLLMLSCSKSQSTAAPEPVTIDCSGTAPTFSGDAKPVIQQVCITCHGRGSNNGPGELNTFDQVFNARGRIRAAVLSGLMPQNATLSTTQKKAIICWIDNGAINN
jgi:hypothetical protein